MNRFKLISILALLLLISSIAGCSGSADISYKLVEKSGYFKVGYDPLSYHTYEGYGLAINVIKNAAQRMGVEAPITPVNYYDWEAHLQNEDIDVMLCKSSETDLQTSVVFTDNILLISRDPENIKNVGVIDSEACVEQKNILSSENNYNYIFFSDKSLLISDLKDNIIDAAIVSEYDIMTENNVSEYNIRILSESPIYFVVSAEKQSFFNALDAVLQQMTLDGTTNRLKNEYIESLK